ncbi:MAG: hypothetical protein AAFX85_00945 [Pseudomonadota bacterium]
MIDRNSKATAQPTTRVVRRRPGSLSLWCLALCLPTLAFAARPVDPPSVEFTRGSNNVVVATVLDKPDLTHVQLKVEALLSGTDEGDFVLRGPTEAFADLAVGERYVVAFTRLANNDQFRDAKFLDPEGARALRLRGARVPSVFHDTPALRFLVSRARGDEQPSDRERLDAVLALMQHHHPRVVAFGVEELYLRNELAEVVTDRDLAIIKATMRDPTLHTQLRQFLLEASLAFPGGATAPWVLEEARRTLWQLGPVLDLQSAESLLASTALESLAAVKDPADLPVLLSMLGANSPPVVRNALKLASALDAPATMSAVRSELDSSLLRDDVHADTRRLFERYLLDALLLDEDAS